MNDILYAEFKEKLSHEILPGAMLAMVEERLFAVGYGEEIFMVYDPLEGYYGIADEFITLEDYLKVRNITVEDLRKTATIYDEAILNEILTGKGLI